MSTSQTRLLAMFAGWAVAWYGIYRREWRGTLAVVAGLGLAAAAMTIGQGEQRGA